MKLFKGKIGQKIDLYAMNNLKYVSEIFSIHLGEKEESSFGVEFSTPPGALDKAYLLNKANKSLFGGTYSLQLVGEVPINGIKHTNSPISMKYKGIMVKGEAYFDTKEDGGKELITILNKDCELLRILTDLDIEKLEIKAEEEKYKICLIPISGSFVYTVFPPMKYAGTINKNEVQAICTALERISQLLQTSVAA